METTYHLVYLEARQLFTETRLSAAEILVEVSSEPVTALIQKAGEDASSMDDARLSRFSQEAARTAALDYARQEMPVTSSDCYDFKIDRVSNPQLITSRVAPSAVTEACRVWLLKKHEFPQQA
jgi:hypothetical protein